jgi:hypothetical protein
MNLTFGDLRFTIYDLRFLFLRMEISFKFPFYFDTFNKLSATLRSGQESQVPNKEI